MASELVSQAVRVEEALRITNTMRIGKSVSQFTQVDSTNVKAAELAKAGAEEGTVIISMVQDAGYGRMNRHWVSPKGGLWLSIILRPDIPPKDAATITLMGACAVVKTLKSILDIDAKIKWPNDVLISGRKVCGILTEMRTMGNDIDFVILGLGINANFHVKEFPEDIRDTTTTLSTECGSDISIEQLLKALISDIDGLYNKILSGDFKFIIEMWKSASDTLGERVRITTLKENIEGIAVDVDETGALVVKTADGEAKTILAGDCVHLTETK